MKSVKMRSKSVATFYESGDTFRTHFYVILQIQITSNLKLSTKFHR